MTRNAGTLCSLFLLLALACAPAAAHKPVIVDGGPSSFENPYVLDDPEVSQVGYHEARDGARELWFAFDLRAGDSVLLEAGVPFIERFAMLRPGIAFIGPGLPQVQTPFPIPEGYGGFVFRYDDAAPDLFDEAFTGTLSWIWPRERPAAAESGVHYAVGFLPSGEDGKFWIAVGEREEFGFSDILRLPRIVLQVRAFHEVSPFGGLIFIGLGAILLLVLIIAGALFARP